MLKVLIVDDSLVFRKVLQEALGRHPTLRVVGTAENGEEALHVVRTLKPDLLILDVEMPKLDGLQTLDELRRRHLHVGVIMFSTLTSEGAQTTLDALAKGAFDFVPKPTGQGAFAESVKRIEEELIPKIDAYAASARDQRMSRLAGLQNLVRRKSPAPAAPGPRPGRAAEPAAASPSRESGARDPITAERRLRRMSQRPEAVAIGVSTGGPNALNEVIPRLPKGFRIPIFLVQHMPPVFTTQLARRLNEKSELHVVEATDGLLVQGGTVYLAPGDYHMEVHSDGANRTIHLTQAPPVNSCRPAVDVLFNSVAKVYGGRTVGVIMTGMGHDGLEGAKELKTKGAFIVSQDKETSVVWGMPRYIAEAGLADRICPLDKIAETILELSGMPVGPSIQRRPL